MKNMVGIENLRKRKDFKMTRERAKQKLFELIETGILSFSEKGLIDSIYDDFEKELEELQQRIEELEDYALERNEALDRLS